MKTIINLNHELTDKSLERIKEDKLKSKVSDKMKNIIEDFKIYLLETGKVTSKMTIESYLGNIRQLLLWLDDNKIDIKVIDRMIILKYLEHLKEMNYKPNTYNTKINSIINFNIYLKDKGIIEKNIIFGKDKIKLSNNKEVDVYTGDEIKLIQEYIKTNKVSSRDRLIIRILMEVAVRVSELINLKLDSIDIVGLEIEVHGKNNKIRNLPIKQKLAEEIRTYISTERKESKYSKSKYLLVSERSEKLHRNTVLEIVKKIGDELSIKTYNHKFRHTLATNMSKRNIPIQVIQQFLGHAEIQTTIEYYVNISKDEMKNAIENI